MLATTASRSHGSPEVRRGFARQVEDRLKWYAPHPQLIERRLPSTSWEVMARPSFFFSALDRTPLTVWAFQ